MRALNQISRRTGTRFSFRFIPLAVLLLSGLVWSALGADLESARKHFIAGFYTNCISECDQAIADFEYQEEWRVLLVRALAATGQDGGVGGVICNALDRYSWSIPLRLLGHEVLPYAG